MRSRSKNRLRKSRGREVETAHHETEVKLRVGNRAAFLRQLARLKAKLARPRVHEMNALYDTGAGDLLRRGQMLRLRVEEPAPEMSSNCTERSSRRGRERAKICAWLTFKGPPRGTKAYVANRYKVREEHEVRFFDHEEMARILETLGLRPSFRYEKFRTTYELPHVSRLKVALDETPIGLFVELEGECDDIDRAAKLLGFAASDYINKSYGALFMEARGVKRARGGSRVEPRPASRLPDMVFQQISQKEKQIPRH
jgi:adenylate cyclase, class 2